MKHLVMKNRIIAAFVVAALALVGISLLVTSQSFSQRDLYGWAYNNATGWLSLNSNNPEAPSGGEPYRIVYNEGTNVILGYAWSNVYGWVSFNLNDVQDCYMYAGVETSIDSNNKDKCGARIEEGELRGFAKILSINRLISLNSKDLDPNPNSTFAVKVREVTTTTTPPTSAEDVSAACGGVSDSSCSLLEGCAFGDHTGWWGFGANTASDCSAKNPTAFSQSINEPTLGLSTKTAVLGIDTITFDLNCNSGSLALVESFTIDGVPQASVVDETQISYNFLPLEAGEKIATLTCKKVDSTNIVTSVSKTFEVSSILISLTSPLTSVQLVEASDGVLVASVELKLDVKALSNTESIRQCVLNRDGIAEGAPYTPATGSSNITETVGVDITADTSFTLECTYYPTVNGTGTQDDVTAQNREGAVVFTILPSDIDG